MALQNHSNRWRTAAFLLAAGVIVFLIVLRFFPIGNDYYYYYRPIADQWLNGDHTLYDGPNQRLFYPPWTLFVILPLGLPSLEAGSALLNTASLLCLLLAITLISRLKPVPRFGLLLALLNLHTFDLFILGQLDLFVLAGLVLCWWAVVKQRPLLVGLGLCLMAIKPVNVLLPVVVILLAVRHWPRRQSAVVFIPPLLMLIVSSVMVGFDWPLKYITNFKDPVSVLAISIWRGAAALELPVWLPALPGLIVVTAVLCLAWRDGLTERTLGLAVAANLAFTIYAHGHYYVLLIPAMIAVSRSSKPLALVAYLATFAPLLRLPYGFGASWVGVLYPLLLLAGLWLVSRSAASSHTNSSA